ncbi:MAG: PH domain-containing protein [Propionibacteriaceae bacterium]|jgi:membrane protein YdbS with pleckstrin-like domain|nr:PH domain-containing protein [Propionibacteriaceae bacterium]
MSEVASQETWKTLPPEALKVRTIGACIRWAIVTLAVVGIAVWIVLGTGSDQYWIIAVTTAAMVVLSAYRVVRNRTWVRRFRYCERAEDLVVDSGLFTRTTEIFPYGRMQVVKVESGPVVRHYGLAEVNLITAGGNGNIPYLRADEAEAMRDRLIALGEAQATPL